MAKKTINFVVHYNQTTKDIYKDFNFPNRPRYSVINDAFEDYSRHFKNVDGVVVNALGVHYLREVEKVLKHILWLMKECKVKYIEVHTSNSLTFAVLDKIFSSEDYNKLFHKVENSITESCSDKEVYIDFNHLVNLAKGK